MNFTPPPLSKHRRARLIAWTLAMLMWMAQVFFCGAAFSDRHERKRGPLMSLDGLTRRVMMLILCRANDLTGFRWRKPRRRRVYRGRDVPSRGAFRALVGVRVRRMLKRKELGERILVLIHAIQHIDHYAALVARRLKRGLTRRFMPLFALPPAPDAPVVMLATLPVCFADSS